MIVVAIIGLLAAIAIPSILMSFQSSKKSARNRNIAEVNKAKAILTLPSDSVAGAMNASGTEPITEGTPGRSNLLKALKITDIGSLTIGGSPIDVGATVGATTSY
jgi:type II secretory pathway pseudopilin PulG